MVRSRAWLLRALAFGITAALVVAACGGTPSAAPAHRRDRRRGGTRPNKAPGPQKGGTIYLLTTQKTGPTSTRSASTPGRISRSSAQRSSARSCPTSTRPTTSKGTRLRPDLATDTGTTTTDGKTWTFTLRDGLNWQDGSELSARTSRTASRARTRPTSWAAVRRTGSSTWTSRSNDDGTSQYPGPYTADRRSSRRCSTRQSAATATRSRST